MPEYEIDRWDNFGVELLTYFIFAGYFYAFIAVSLSLPLLYPPFRRRFPRFWHFSFLFPLSIYVCGAIGHAFWSKYIWGHYYYSPDYVIDFLPFLPITETQVRFRFGDQEGRLLGDTTMGQLRLIWLYFAIPTWVATLALYKMMTKAFGQKLFKAKAAEIDY